MYLNLLHEHPQSIIECKSYQRATRNGNKNLRPGKLNSPALRTLSRSNPGKQRFFSKATRDVATLHCRIPSPFVLRLTLAVTGHVSGESYDPNARMGGVRNALCDTIVSCATRGHREMPRDKNSIHNSIAMPCLGHRGGVREVRWTGMSVVMLPISVGGFWRGNVGFWQRLLTTPKWDVCLGGKILVRI